jgi:hypothetical protein
MKKIFCLAFVLFAVAAATAQEKTIEKAEFDAVSRPSMRKYLGQSYRQTTTTQNIIDDSTNLPILSKTVFEHTAARASRMVYEFSSPTLNVKRETITVGGKIYSRIDGGEWTEKKLETPRPMVESSLKMVEEKIAYKSLGTELLNGEKTDVYEKIQNQKRINESTGGETFSIVTTKYWYGKDGGILKQEQQMEIRVKLPADPKEKITRHSMVNVWELDPEIKIEEPVAAK